MEIFGLAWVRGIFLYTTFGHVRGLAKLDVPIMGISHLSTCHKNIVFFHLCFSPLLFRSHTPDATSLIKHHKPTIWSLQPCILSNQEVVPSSNNNNDDEAHQTVHPSNRCPLCLCNPFCFCFCQRNSRC